MENKNIYSLLDDSGHCKHCGKSATDLSNGKYNCPYYAVLVATVMGMKGPLYHFWKMLKCIFNFSFLEAITYGSWCVESMFKIGDYNQKTGIYRKSLIGTLKWPSNNE